MTRSDWIQLSFRFFFGAILLLCMWVFHSRFCLYLVVTLIAIATEIQGFTLLILIRVHKAMVTRAINGARLEAVLSDSAEVIR